MAMDDTPSSTEMLNFILKNGEFKKAGLRLGQLTVQGRPSRPTPTFIASTSRGVVPHITQDALSKLTDIPAVYIGLEDSHSSWLVIEKKVSKAPLFKQPMHNHSTSRLRDFICLPDDIISILGPRRNPPVETPNHNTSKGFAICTSVGFQMLDPDDYLTSSHDLRADITLSLADIVRTESISQKRLQKSADYTEIWMHYESLSRDFPTASGAPHYTMFASIPPIEPSLQWSYLTELNEAYGEDVKGLGLYSPETAVTLPEFLESLPRICLTNPETPHDLIRAVELGNDLIAAPFVTGMSENGTALSFTLYPDSSLLDAPIGIDMWSTSHNTSLSPLVKGCTCYTCTKHHRAFVHHLLSAKEMLAWTLLQIHNFHTISVFFRQIRESIEDGTFEQQAKTFGRAYDRTAMQSSGQGPRVRGYQMKSQGGGEPRKNQKAYGRLDEQAKKAQKAELDAKLSAGASETANEDPFFLTVREKIDDGTFKEHVETFKYGSGKKPRADQPRSEASQEEESGVVNEELKEDERALKLQEAQSGVATPEVEENAEELERHGLGKAQP